MWKLLSATGIAPEGIDKAEHDDRMLPEAGVGFVDVGCGYPGTDSAAFSSKEVQQWGDGFYRRLSDHVERSNQALGCACGGCGAPHIVAFAGMRQWKELLNKRRSGKGKVTKLDYGLQELRPEGWPLPPRTQVWLLTSSSGAAALTNEAREAPYRE